MQNNLSFINVPQMQAFNDKVSTEVDGIKPVEKPKVEFNSGEFDSYVASPESLDDETIYDIADIIDGKVHFNKNDELPFDKTAPNTIDRLDDAIAIAFVTKDGIPVAVGTLTDPTKENFKGIIPITHYELKSGISLEGRMHQEFFAISYEYKGMGISDKLRTALEKISDKMFITVNVSDIDTIEGLKNNGYKFISQFTTDWEKEPVQLWIFN